MLAGLRPASPWPAMLARGDDPPESPAAGLRPAPRSSGRLVGLVIPRSGQNGAMPELPEVEALAADLRERLRGKVVEAAHVAEIAVLKTCNPPLAALRETTFTGASRHGKFLDLVAAPAAGDGAAPGRAAELHLIVHLARAGWLRWREELPPAPPRPGKGPLAFRLRFTDGTGFDLTEQGTRKRLAVYLVTDPAQVPGIASLGPDPLSPEFTTQIMPRTALSRGIMVWPGRPWLADHSSA
jgi:formamidopyrimidine-DNA glycosylase